MGLLDRLRRRTRTGPEAPRPVARPRPGKTDIVPPTADALVVYGLDGADGVPDSRTPCMVVLDFDPVDVRQIFAAGPALERRVRADFERRLQAPGAIRDPNSRGRLEFIRRWLVDHDPSHVGWRLEPAATAGGGDPPR